MKLRFCIEASSIGCFERIENAQIDRSATHPDSRSPLAGRLMAVDPVKAASVIAADPSVVLVLCLGRLTQVDRPLVRSDPISVVSFLDRPVSMHESEHDAMSQ